MYQRQTVTVSLHVYIFITICIVFFFFFYPLRNFCREDCRRRCYAWKSDLFCSPRLCSDTPVKKKRRTWQQKDTIKKGQKKKKRNKEALTQHSRSSSPGLEATAGQAGQQEVRDRADACAPELFCAGGRAACRTHPSAAGADGKGKRGQWRGRPDWGSCPGDHAT